MSIVCPNTNCRNTNGERTTLPSEVSFCFVCGRAISEKAKEKQKKEIKNIRNRRLNDAKSENSLLKTKLLESKKNNDNLEIDLKNTVLEIESLKAQLDVEIGRNGKSINPEQSLIIPHWVFMVFCLVGFVFIFLLSIFHNG